MGDKKKRKNDRVSEHGKIKVRSNAKLGLQLAVAAKNKQFQKVLTVMQLSLSHPSPRLISMRTGAHVVEQQSRSGLGRRIWIHSAHARGKWLTHESNLLAQAFYRMKKWAYTLRTHSRAPDLVRLAKYRGSIAGTRCRRHGARRTHRN